MNTPKKIAEHSGPASFLKNAAGSRITRVWPRTLGGITRKGSCQYYSLAHPAAGKIFKGRFPWMRKQKKLSGLVPAAIGTKKNCQVWFRPPSE
jgi:hypothetical protein